VPAIQLAKYMIETGPHIPSEPQGGLDARFCEAMDAAPVMIWVSGEDKLCIWFNRPWLEFTGRTLAEELGNGWAEGVHPEDFDRCLEIYVSHFDARTKFRTQYRMRRHDGEYRWIDDIGIPRYARDGSFLGYFGSCTDVTTKKRWKQSFAS
jgi:PAS domain S-box-containing protein